MAGYTTDYLLASVRRRASIPSATSPGTADSDLLAYADEEVLSYLAPLVLSVHEDHFLFSEDFSLVSGQLTYRLPYRAIAGSLREVAVVSADGKSIRRLPRIDVGDLQNANDGFWFNGDAVTLVADPGSTTNKLRLRYQLRPGTHVASSSVATITAINTATSTVTCNALPSGFVSSFPVALPSGLSTVYDFVRAKPQFETLSIDNVASVSGSDMTFAALPRDLAVGDYVCLAGQTAVPQIPPELHSLLAQKVANTVMQAVGDYDGLEIGEKKSERLEADAMKLLAGRSEASPQKIVNRGSLFRRGAASWFGR